MKNIIIIAALLVSTSVFGQATKGTPPTYTVSTLGFEAVSSSKIDTIQTKALTELNTFIAWMVSLPATKYDQMLPTISTSLNKLLLEARKEHELNIQTKR